MHPVAESLLPGSVIHRNYWVPLTGGVSRSVFALIWMCPEDLFKKILSTLFLSRYDKLSGGCLVQQGCVSFWEQSRNITILHFDGCPAKPFATQITIASCTCFILECLCLFHSDNASQPTARLCFSVTGCVPCSFWVNIANCALLNWSTMKIYSSLFFSQYRSSGSPTRTQI